MILSIDLNEMTNWGTSILVRGNSGCKVYVRVSLRYSKEVSVEAGVKREGFGGSW